jgi:diamine N-acetyltransferase
MSANAISVTAGAARQSALPEIGGAAISPLTAQSLRDGAVVIGPVLPEDTAALFLWLNDAQTAELDMPFRPMDWMGYNNWLTEISRNASQVFFAIRRISHPAIIGFVALTKIHPVHRCAELSVRIGAEGDRGKGYGAAAIALALRYAWNQLNLHRVHLTVFSTNQRAIGAYNASGFQCEGLLRQAAFINGAWCDVIQMGVLRSAPGPR